MPLSPSHRPLRTEFSSTGGDLHMFFSTRGEQISNQPVFRTHSAPFRHPSLPPCWRGAHLRVSRRLSARSTWSAISQSGYRPWGRIPSARDLSLIGSAQISQCSANERPRGRTPRQPLMVSGYGQLSSAPCQLGVSISSVSSVSAFPASGVRPPLSALPPSASAGQTRHAKSDSQRHTQNLQSGDPGPS